MSSIVEELQRGALDRNTQVSDLLRMAKVISMKLNLPDLAKWVDHELNGYGVTEVPAYRIINVQLKGQNPFHGWQPVLFNDEVDEDIFTRHPMDQRVAELEHTLSKVAVGSDKLMIALSGQKLSYLINTMGMDSPFAFIFSSGKVWGILDAIRNALLDWSLKLEQAGIKGENLSFSNEEREKAHQGQTTYHINSIGTFTGNLGANSGTVNATSHQAPAEDVLKLVEKIKANEQALNLSDAEIVRLRTALDNLMSEIKQPVPNRSKVQQAVASTRNIVEGTVGSLAASGILYELAKLFP